MRYCGIPPRRGDAYARKSRSHVFMFSCGRLTFISFIHVMIVMTYPRSKCLDWKSRGLRSSLVGLGLSQVSVHPGSRPVVSIHNRQDLGFRLRAKTGATSSRLLDDRHEARAC